jgi:hypothetical protein
MRDTTIAEPDAGDVAGSMRPTGEHRAVSAPAESEAEALQRALAPFWPRALRPSVTPKASRPARAPRS